MHSLATDTKNDIKKELKIQSEQRWYLNKRKLYKALCMVADQRYPKQSA
jgi:hypothetical protein